MHFVVNANGAAVRCKPVDVPLARLRAAADGSPHARTTPRTLPSSELLGFDQPSLTGLLRISKASIADRQGIDVCEMIHPSGVNGIG